jgi:hypothetical protein
MIANDNCLSSPVQRMIKDRDRNETRSQGSRGHGGHEAKRSKIVSKQWSPLHGFTVNVIIKLMNVNDYNCLVKCKHV